MSQFIIEEGFDTGPDAFQFEPIDPVGLTPIPDGPWPIPCPPWPPFPIPMPWPGPCPGPVIDDMLVVEPEIDRVVLDLDALMPMGLG